MSIWSLGPLMGPVIGPIAGGFLSQSKGWRWVFWVITIGVGLSKEDVLMHNLNGGLTYTGWLWCLTVYRFSSRDI